MYRFEAMDTTSSVFNFNRAEAELGEALKMHEMVDSEQSYHHSQAAFKLSVKSWRLFLAKWGERRPAGFQNLGVALLFSGEIDEAIGIFRNTVRASPKCTRCLISLARALVHGDGGGGGDGGESDGATAEATAEAIEALVKAHALSKMPTEVDYIDALLSDAQSREYQEAGPGARAAAEVDIAPRQQGLLQDSSATTPGEPSNKVTEGADSGNDCDAESSDTLEHSGGGREDGEGRGGGQKGASSGSVLAALLGVNDQGAAKEWFHSVYRKEWQHIRAPWPEEPLIGNKFLTVRFIHSRTPADSAWQAAVLHL